MVVTTTKTIGQFVEIEIHRIVGMKTPTKDAIEIEQTEEIETCLVAMDLSIDKTEIELIESKGDPKVDWVGISNVEEEFRQARRVQKSAGTV